MTMDQTTESIAHFIGLFELKIEELRLRQDYLEFRLKKTEQETSSLEPVGVRLQAPHELLPFEPGLDFAQTQSEVVSTSLTFEDFNPLANPPSAVAPDAPSPENLFEAAARIQSFAATFSLTPPGSLVSVTLQKITLNDNDLFVTGPGFDFLDPEVLHASLEVIIAQAEALMAFAMPVLPTDGNWMAFAQGMLAAIDAVDTSEGSVVRGEDATGVFVDGVTVAEAPVWTDLLPLHLRPETTAADEDPQIPDDDAATDGETVQSLTEGPGTGQAQMLEAHDFGRDFEGHDPQPQAPQPGHQIVSGGNTAINEISLYSKWLDASVYVVLGDAARIDAISQVNALVEHDTIDGVAQSQPSLATNLASITTISSADPAEPAQMAGGPAATFIARLEADLIQVNWVKQFTFVTDYDRAEMVFSGSSTFLGLGENEMVNSAILNEFGYEFDLVFVSGDMVDATIVSQKNVLFDSDHVSTDGPTMAARATVPVPVEDPERSPETDDTAPAVAEIARGDEDATMEARDAATEPQDAASLQVAKVAAVAMIEEAPAQIAGLSQGDAPASPTAVVEPADHATIPDTPVVSVPQPDAQPALSVADNLLLNEVMIQRTGVDSFVKMKQAFQEAAEEMRDGARTLASEVAEDAIFAGMGALRVLQIDGDLARINLFDQTNIIGDADQIRLEMARLREELGAEAELIAGSNALVNRVSIIADGIDSKIMAAQNTYSDALIHQAELYDAESVPTGVTMSNLANEAVAAFIAQDAMGAAETTEHIAPTGNYDAGSTADVMQTMLG